MGEAIVITSGKGGVGKTNTVANLGIALAAVGKRVALIDTDLGLRNLDIVLGLENRVVYDITHVASKERELRTAMVKDKRYNNLQLLAASQTKDKDTIKDTDVQWMVNDLLKDFDFVLVDCPAGIDRGFKNATGGVGSAIVVTTPEVPSVRDADRTIGVLEDMGIRSSVVINKVRPGMVKRNEMLDITSIMDILNAQLLGVIPDDEAIIASTNKSEPTVIYRPDANASIAFRNIASRMMGVQVPFLEIKRPGLFSRLSSAFRG